MLRQQDPAEPSVQHFLDRILLQFGGDEAGLRQDHPAEKTLKMLITTTSRHFLASASVIIDICAGKRLVRNVLLQQPAASVAFLLLGALTASGLLSALNWNIFQSSALLNMAAGNTISIL